MSEVISSIYQTKALNGLNTYTHTALQTSMYVVDCETDIQLGSSAVVSIAQTGSASVTVTSPAPVPSQHHISLSTILNCVAGDLITVTISSSNPIDQQLNAVKTLLKITPGIV